MKPNTWDFEDLTVIAVAAFIFGFCYSAGANFYDTILWMFGF